MEGATQAPTFCTNTGFPCPWSRQLLPVLTPSSALASCVTLGSYSTPGDLHYLIRDTGGGGSARFAVTMYNSAGNLPHVNPLLPDHAEHPTEAGDSIIIIIWAGPTGALGDTRPLPPSERGPWLGPGCHCVSEREPGPFSLTLKEGR